MNRHSGNLLCGAALACFAGAAQADIVISTQPTANMSCAGGVCAPTAATAVLNATDLENLLAAGNVEVTTTGSGVQANNIVASAGVTWSGAATLTLDARQSLTFDNSVAVTGAGGLTLLTNDGGSGGALSFGPTGNVTFQNLSSALSINGAAYTLVNSLATFAATGGKGFIALAQSYDASADGTYTTAPMPELYGAFEGLGNTISNLTVNDTSEESVGLIGFMSYTASVRDLQIANANITGSTLGAGALTGSADGLIYGVSSSGTVTAGGAGGLIGITNGGTLINSHSSANVFAGEAGGLAMEIDNGVVDDCYATGQVSADPDAFNGLGGGLIGLTGESVVEYSFATGGVSGGANAEIGGLVGATVEHVKVMEAYATGSVTGGTNARAGGLIGSIDLGGKYTKSYATGAVTAGSGSAAGGLAGYIYNQTRYSFSISDEYWDTDTSGQTAGVGNQGNISGVSGLTTSQFQSRLPKGLSKKVWAETAGVNGGFPYLIGNPPPE
jgi:hypothetical protein